MKRLLITLTLLLCGALLSAQTTKERLTSHVYYLASDSLRGREAGSPDALKAADYILSEYVRIGLKPFFADGYKQKFGEYTNIVALIEGSDPTLKDEYIVLGAHYDHLGVKEGKIYNGADDNASGSAALIEIARQLYANRESLKRSIIIAAFDAEELGLFGSEALVKALKKDGTIDKVRLMMSIDMVGWYKAAGTLKLEGVATIRDGQKLVSDEASKVSITVTPKDFEKSVLTATDTEAFAMAGVPTLSVTTGLKSPYHKPEDDAELIDYDGLEKVSEYIADLSETAASDASFAASGKVARKHRTTLPVFEAGLTASFSSSTINFRKSALTSKSASGVAVGPQFQLNIKDFGLNVKALYEVAASEFPDDAALWRSSLTYRQHSLTVPVMIMGNAFSTYAMRFYVGFGAYYSYVFSDNASGTRKLSSETVQIEPNQFGIAYCIGMQAGPVVLGLEGRVQKNDLFTHISAPSARLSSFCLTLGYNF